MTTDEEEIKVWIDLCDKHAKLLIDKEDYDSVNRLGKNNDDDLLKWAESEVEKRRFASLSHALNFALNELKQKK